jgi:hypothetical protein
VVKLIGANALLPWLTHQFNFSFTPIHFLRHPFAIVASQAKRPAWKKAGATGFKVPNCRFNEVYLQHQNFLSTLETRAEAMTAWWCLENSIPLRSPHNNVKWITLHYENLLMNPEIELRKIFTRWGIEMPASILDQVQQPSTTTTEATFLQSKEKQLSKWQESLGADQIFKMRRVLDYFEIECYNEGFLPVQTGSFSEPDKTVQEAR